MATIPSYPQATPGPEDLLLGINIVAEGGVDAPKTRTFTIGSIVDLVETYNVAQNLQQVTTVGADTTLDITANSFVKSGGGPNQLLAANGDSIVAGNNITISGGAISSTGGGGGETNLTTSQTASNFTINSSTGDDAVVPLGNGTLAGATLNNYTTDEKNKLGAISGTNTGDNATNTQYSGLAASKQDTLQNTVNIKSINGDSLLGSGNLTISGGGSSPQSAYTMLANNTNATAVPTEKVYKEVAQQSLSGTGMTATGGTLPSGLQSHSYRWSQVGNLVTVRITLEFQNSGICNGISIPFANMPDIPQIPQIPPSIFTTSVGQVITHGAGNMAGTPQFYPSPVGFGTSAIIVKTIGTPNTYAFCVGRETDPYYKGFIHIQYYI